MIQSKRETWLAIALLVVLMLLTIAAAVYKAQTERHDPPLASFSSSPDGARALWLWLQALGYQVSDQAEERFAVPEKAKVALVFEPTVEIVAREWTAIDRWVEGGGTLLLAGEQGWTSQAMRHYGFTLSYLAAPADILQPQTPLMASPPLLAPVDAHARAWLRLGPETETAYVAHLAAGDKPVLVSSEQGAGQVILCSAPFVFSNAGLKVSGNPPLVLNLVSAVERGGTIWFDEWHHGVQARAAPVIGPWSWLRRTPAGRSLLYVAAVVFVSLLLRGRRFGRPVPLIRTTARRATLEYITAIANLGLQAGHREAVLHQYHHQLKRDLGRRYRLDATLDDEEYVRRLATLNPALDAQSLQDLLSRLRTREIGERETIQLAASAAQWLKELR
jgi:hypothetical protein